VNVFLRALHKLATLDGSGPTGEFMCPKCGATEFVMVTNPVHSTSRTSDSRTKVMVRCDGKKPCLMRWVFVSKDFGKSWSPYAPSN
jgi:hypothetical protein